MSTNALYKFMYKYISLHIFMTSPYFMNISKSFNANSEKFTYLTVCKRLKSFAHIKTAKYYILIRKTHLVKNKLKSFINKIVIQN